MTTNYNDGKWYAHNGGKCPVHPETVVACVVLCSDGTSEGLGATKAKEYTWHNNHDSPIIAFRVIKEHKEPCEFWIFDRFAFPTHDGALTFAYGKPGEIIHVREVTK